MQIRGLTWIDKPELKQKDFVYYSIFCIILYTIMSCYSIELAIIIYGICWICYNSNNLNFTDERLLWEQSRFLQKLSWKNQCKTIPYRDYICFQSPHLTYVISKIPTLWSYRSITLTWSLVSIYIISLLVGEFIAYCVLITPIFWWLCGSVSHDIYAFNCCISTLACSSIPYVGAVFFGIACVLKYTFVFLFPIMISWWGFLSIGCILLYYITFRDSYLLRKHWNMILERIILKKNNVKYRGQGNYYYHVFDWDYLRSILIYIFPLLLSGSYVFYGYLFCFYIMRLQPKYYLMLLVCII